MPKKSNKKADEKLELEPNEDLIDLPDEVNKDESDKEEAIAAPGKELSKVMDATQIYLSEIGFSPLLSAEEEVLYSTKALEGHEPSRKKMIESNFE